MGGVRSGEGDGGLVEEERSEVSHQRRVLNPALLAHPTATALAAHAAHAAHAALAAHAATKEVMVLGMMLMHVAPAEHP